MARPEPAWRPWVLALGTGFLACLLLFWGVRALDDPWPRMVAALLLILLILLLGLTVIDGAFGRPFGMTRWAYRALHRFTAQFARNPGRLWLAWAMKTSNPPWCLDCLSRSAALGDPEGMREYGRHFLDGGMGSSARGAALPWLRRAAEAGDAQAAFFLAEMTRWGLGVAAKTGEAQAWYHRSAEGGFRPAARWLSQAYSGGEGFEEAPEKAKHWARLAEDMAGEDRPGPSLLSRLAECEDPTGATATEIMDEVGEALWSMKGYRILVMILAGLLLGVAALFILSIPPLLAVFLSVSIYFLGMVVMMRLLGHHAPRPSRQGRKLEARTEAGEAEAHFQLGLRFEKGHYDVPKDLALARQHFSQSVEGGHALAALHLADLLSWGMGGPKDLLRARSLLERLARTGHPEAAAKLQRLGPGLSPEGPSADQGSEERSP